MSFAALAAAMAIVASAGVAATHDGAAPAPSAAAPMAPARHGNRSAARIAATRELKRQVAESLANPASARFDRLSFGRINGPRGPVASLCGRVTARDVAGRTIGTASFIATSERGVITDANDPFGAFRHLWPVWCVKPAAAARSALPRPALSEPRTLPHDPPPATDIRLAAAASPTPR